MLSGIRKFITAIVGNGTLIAEFELLPHGGREIVIILTAIATMLGVYAVPNAGTNVPR